MFYINHLLFGKIILLLSFKIKILLNFTFISTLKNLYLVDFVNLFRNIAHLFYLESHHPVFHQMIMSLIEIVILIFLYFTF